MTVVKRIPLSQYYTVLLLIYFDETNFENQMLLKSGVVAAGFYAALQNTLLLLAMSLYA